MIVLAGFLYLTQVNASAVKGYIIRDLELKIEEQKIISKNLELTSQEKQSVSSVVSRVTEMGLVSADQIKYLQAPGGEVAVAR